MNTVRKTNCVICRNGNRLVYFRYDDEVWVDADLGIWRWGWEDKLIEAEGAPTFAKQDAA